jgi:3-oxoadipate enol-lactonase
MRADTYKAACVIGQHLEVGGLIEQTKERTTMPSVKLADVSLNYRFDGAENAPVLVLSNSLGTDLHMWDDQVAAFAEHFRVLRYDTRGHGGSSVTPGPYSIEQLGQDVLGMLDAFGIERFAFCGLSMGGLIGQWLGIHAGERLQRLVLCNTGAKIGTDEVWNTRIDSVLTGREQTMRDMRDASIARWFTAEFAQANPAVAARITDMIASTSPDGYAANCAAVRDADYRGQLAAVKAPTLIVCGAKDPVTTVEHGEFIQANIPGAELVAFEAAHLSNVEAGDAFTQRVLTFLRG